MSPATGARAFEAPAPANETPSLAEVPKDRVRLLTVDAMRETFDVSPFADFASHLVEGDVLVVNDAATLPASVWATTEDGASVELRLFDPRPGEWSAVVLGAGDWRTRTELRGAPPALSVGARVSVGGVSAQVVAAAPASARLVRLRFEANDETVWRVVYANGRPVQYAHRPTPEGLWAFQNVYSSRPWAAEHVSAGRALSWAHLLGLRRRGVRVVALTEGAGLSASGDPVLDAALPLPERCDIPPPTAAAVNAATWAGRQVVAVGTSVMRALESNAAEHGGTVTAGESLAPLVIDRHHRRQVVSGLLTGIHSPQESHYRLLESLVAPRLLEEASALARRAGLQEHEAGDAMFIRSTRPRAPAPARTRWW